MNGHEINSEEEIGSCFNKHFTSFGSLSTQFSEKESINFINNNFKSNPTLIAPPKFDGKFNFQSTTSKIIEKLLDKLNSRSSPGISDIPTAILKDSSKIIAPFLAKFFNDCIKSNFFPDEFKIALFKNKGQRDDMNIYRGISILPPIAKIFEKI